MTRDDAAMPRYVISVVARIVGVHAQTLRYYERAGLVEPSRSSGNIRLYSDSDLDKLIRIKNLMGDLGVNLAGVEVILRMAQKLVQMETQIQKLTAQLEASKQARK